MIIVIAFMLKIFFFQNDDIDEIVLNEMIFRTIVHDENEES